jgi:mono/diheme cytochrome c family protein
MNLRVAALACGVIGLSSCQWPGTSLAPTGLTVKTASFRGEVVPVLREHCAGCHTLGRPGATSVPMFDEAGEALYQGIRPHFYHMLYTIDSGQMPKGRPGSLPAEASLRLKAWRDAGMPDN